MEKLSRGDLHSLEQYTELRDGFRAEVMAHKKNRRLPIGPNVTLYFEDRLTMHYQIQEMLRVERIFDRQGIEDELEAYNPLIPDGRNLKATFMIEYGDPVERQRRLKLMKGIEDCVWLQIGSARRVFPVADEDIERETSDRTSSVHFLRFELTSDMIRAVKENGDLNAGIDHPAYSYGIEPIPGNIQAALIRDLD